MTNAGEAHDRDIDLVMITGAGASREFGMEGQKMPLMGDWSDALVTKLAQHHPYLEATGLQQKLLGEQFETQLGRFLRQVEAIKQSRELLKVSGKFLNTGSVGIQLQAQGAFEAWYDQTASHLDAITDLIHESLYEQFAGSRPNFYAADRCYQSLFRQLGVSVDTRLVYATTNYDVIGEHAIREFGRWPDWGSPPTDQGASESPLDVNGLLASIGRYTPVLHLHGRVGWYRMPDGRVRSLAAHQHSKNYGIPIVMLPDPDKVYDKDDIINTLWSEFAAALSRARRVFVLGHSLNDAFLVRALLDHVHPYDRIAVTALPDEPGSDFLGASGQAVELKVRETFGEMVEVIPFAFGVNQDMKVPGVPDWNDRLTRGGLL